MERAQLFTGVYSLALVQKGGETRYLLPSRELTDKKVLIMKKKSLFLTRLPLVCLLERLLVFSQT